MINTTVKRRFVNGFPKSLIAIIGLIFVLAVVAAGCSTANDTEKKTESSPSTKTTTTKAVTLKQPDWQTFKSKKYGFTMNYPKDYVLEESAVGTIILTKNSIEMVDLYVSVAGSSGDAVKKEVATYMDSAREYMTGASEVDTTIASNINATMVTGVFGKNAAIHPHTGTKGSTTFFVKDGNLFMIDSFYNDNTTDFQIYRDILDDLRF